MVKDSSIFVAFLENMNFTRAVCSKSKKSEQSLKQNAFLTFLNTKVAMSPSQNVPPDLLKSS
jgi:hypothetical protein